MLSEEKERVPFKTLVDPLAAGGLVERWLIDTERSMREALKVAVVQAVASYTAETPEKRVDRRRISTDRV
eukprot:1189954-Prorocentrum_minimum.AAC.1